ncbi:MAG: gliding motility protein GldM [Bacteroidetes bacterium]|nr:gliding motility protein GldM [Bacteroidota bacterium]MCL2303160.1 gliding motility protein GldM [Lentimicrobiaceae bacterium]
MGATNCPETPRQRMIGMMYLVLTAMLALNVSKDILNAFTIVDETLGRSNQITMSKNAQDYAELLRQKAILGEEKVAREFEKAMQLKELSNEMIDFIENLRIRYIEFVEGAPAINPDGTPKSVAQLRFKDNKSKSTLFMINDGNAIELRNRLEAYREQLLLFVDEKDREIMSQTIGLNVNETFRNASGAPESWEVHYFENVIFAAGVTLLNKTIGEVRNAESSILKYIISSISRDDFKFSNVTGKVIPKSQLVFQGEPFEAEIIVAAYDDQQPIEVWWRMGTGEMTSPQGNLLTGDAGVARLKIPTNQVGDFNFTGLIKMTGPDGLPQTFPFSNGFTVMAPSATVAADKMNVLYAGIDNPVSVSASVPAERVSISLAGGGNSTKTGPGRYNISVPESLVGKTVTVNIAADMSGRQQTMGSKEFRVRRVPDPVAVLGGNFRGGKISKAELLANPFVTATMGTDFVYDLTWTVNSFHVTFIIRGIEEAPITSNSRQFSDAVRNKINSSAPGTTILFSDIRVSSVAGSRTLNPITVILR